MDGPMEFLRIELLHPLLVHFPVAFLIGATAIQLACLVVRDPAWSEKLRFSSKLLLFLGVCGAWAAVWSGGEAEEVVEKLICAPDVIHEHEDWAQRSAYMFSAALLLWIVLDTYNWLSRKAVNLAIGVSLVLSAVNLGYAAHLGATLVYQQGAAVHRASEPCSGSKPEQPTNAESN